MASTVVAVGDELLGGFVLDTNSHWLAQRLRLLGRPLKRVSLVRDRPPEIAEQLRRDLDDPEVEDVFCCGGLGPTPDDRTMEGVALALGRELVIWQPVLERIERRLRQMQELGLIEASQVSEGHRHMARVPADPDHVFRNRRGMAPALMLCAFGRRLFVLPGVPMELRSVFTDEIEPEFLADRRPATVRELCFAYAMEACFYPVLRELEAAHPRVSVGSYPQLETKELVIRLLGEDEAEVQEAAELVRRRAAAMGLSPR